MDFDRIEKKIILKAPRERVWRAITNWARLGRWFGVKSTAPSSPGEKRSDGLFRQRSTPRSPACRRRIWARLGGRWWSESSL